MAVPTLPTQCRDCRAVPSARVQSSPRRAIQPHVAKCLAQTGFARRGRSLEPAASTTGPAACTVQPHWRSLFAKGQIMDATTEVEGEVERTKNLLKTGALQDAIFQSANFSPSIP